MSLNDKIKLNVGGKTFLTTRATLTSCPESTLSKMFHPESNIPPATVDEDGSYFLDANPKYFGIILDWLRHRELLVDPGIDLNNVAKMADYFGMLDLRHVIENKSKSRPRAVWMNRPTVLSALKFHHHELGNHVISRVKDGQLEIVPEYEDPCRARETLIVKARDDQVGWVKVERGDVPSGAIQVGEGKQMHIGISSSSTSGYLTTLRGAGLQVGFVDEEGIFKPTHAYQVTHPNSRPWCKFEEVDVGPLRSYEKLYVLCSCTD